MASGDWIQIRVRPRNLRWELSINGVTRRMVDWFCTRERAIEHAVKEAEWLLAWESPDTIAAVVVERADRTEDERVVVTARRRAS